MAWCLFTLPRCHSNITNTEGQIIIILPFCVLNAIDALWFKLFCPLALSWCHGRYLPFGLAPFRSYFEPCYSMIRVMGVRGGEHYRCYTFNFNTSVFQLLVTALPSEILYLEIFKQRIFMLIVLHIKCSCDVFSGSRPANMCECPPIWLSITIFIKP